MKRPTLFALLVIVTFVLWPAKLSAGNLLFILDASGSMNGQIDGRAKMQIARRALSKLIGDLPSDSSVGLMTYGHRVSPRAQGACSDIQLLVPIAKDQVRAVTGLMSAIEPRGKTPIAGSLALAPAAFRGHEGGNNNIVLISEEKTLLSRIDDLKNVFRLSKPLPPGDWTITMRFKPSVATFREVISLALHTDKDHFLAASALVSVAPYHGRIKVNLLGRKISAGKATDFTKNMFLANAKLGHANLATETQKYNDLAAKELHAMTLRIRKVGRSYHIAGKVEGDGTQLDAQSKWVELDKLTSLRAPGKSIVIAVGQAKHHGQESIRGGETLINIDWIKIEKQ